MKDTNRIHITVTEQFLDELNRLTDHLESAGVNVRYQDSHPSRARVIQYAVHKLLEEYENSVKTAEQLN